MTHARIARYLHELVGAVEETATNLALLPVLVGILLRAPMTLVEVAWPGETCPRCGRTARRAA